MSYSSIEGGVKIGDQLHIDYKVTPEGTFSFRSVFNDAALFGVLLFDLKSKSVRVQENGSINITSDLEEEVFIGKDYISLDSFGTVVEFYRYYKDDWQGLLLNTGFNGRLGAHAITLDCRVRGSGISEFSAAIADIVAAE